MQVRQDIRQLRKAVPPLKHAQWLPEFARKGDPAITMLALVLGKDHEPGDPDCGGSTAHNRDMMFIEHNRTGYQDGDGPGNEYILERSKEDTAVPKRWTPRITIWEDNTTCISTKQERTDEGAVRACGVYVFVD